MDVAAALAALERAIGDSSAGLDGSAAQIARQCERLAAAAASKARSPVRQTDFSPGKGNALQACVASFFGLPMAVVPNFITLECGYARGIAEFVSGSVLLSNRRRTMMRKVPLAANALTEADVGRLCLLRGRSPRGDHGHVVLARLMQLGQEEGVQRCQWEMVHDPHPDDTFLAPQSEEVFGWAMFFDVQADADAAAVAAPPPPSGHAVNMIQGLSEEQLQATLRAISDEARAKLRAAFRATAANATEQALCAQGQSLGQRFLCQPFADCGLPAWLESGEWQGNHWGTASNPYNPLATALLEEQKTAGAGIDLPPIQRKNPIMDWSAEAMKEADKGYSPCAESVRAPGVPEGRYERFEDWFCEGGVYPRVRRNVGVYIPRACSGQSRVGLMVFLDGDSYSNEKDGADVKACSVIDTLTHSGQLPPMAAVFVNAGRETGPGEAQRHAEYNPISDAYVRFLLDELLPGVEERCALKFSDDPTLRGICGCSSGGLCAFNAAWHRPDSFGCVISHCGSFGALSGGHNYPFLVRAMARKPIRIVLTSGANDHDQMEGNFALCNHMMADALRWRAYDYRYDFGHGHHSTAHGGSLFAEHLRWLFRK